MRQLSFSFGRALLHRMQCPEAEALPEADAFRNQGWQWGVQRGSVCVTMDLAPFGLLGNAELFDSSED
jgi:hypothetical protein